MYLGIDVGTSAVKVALASAPSAVVATTSRELPVSHPHPGWSEQNPDDWWHAVIAACQDLRAGHALEWSAVKAIGLSGQMHGAVLLDETHAPIRPAILWNDGRSARQCAEMQAAMPDIGDIGGVPPMPGFTAPKILWLKQNEPEAHARIRHVLLPKDEVRRRLTGTLITDMADAAGTLWLDQRTRSWSQELCDVSATRMEWLPELREGTQSSGTLTLEAAEALGLSESVIVATGGGDAATGAMGIGAIRDGDAFISLGTSGQLFGSTSTYRPRPEAAIHAYAHCVPETWFQMAAMLNGASPMQWFASVADVPIGKLLSEAEMADDNNVLFLPYLTGERTPLNDADIRSGFFGLAAATDRGGMMRAVVEAIAYSFCDAQDALAKAGTNITAPAAIGGGARSDFVLQTMSDALGVTITRYYDAETGPALGAARLAMVAAGTHTLDEVAEKPAIDRTFEPDQSRRDHHDRKLKRYRALYRAVKDV